jgi:hypothetical protein
MFVDLCNVYLFKDYFAVHNWGIENFAW